MANPTWFIEQDYLASKLKQLQADGNTTYPDTASLKVAIEAAGFTLFDHFTTFGAAERTSPNSLFNATEYLEAKVKALNAPGSTTVWTVDSVAAAFAAAGATPWDHYQQWGAAEGLNPSNAFDTSSYYEAKVAKLNSTQTEKVWTVDEVKAAFAEAGLSPVSHYLSVGTAEGLTVTPVPAAEQVTPDARDVGKTFTLTTSANTFTGTEKNDVITATTATLGEGDVLVDTTSTDNDVIKLTATADVAKPTTATISGFEKLEVNWDAFSDAAVNLNGFQGLKELSVSTVKVGSLGNLNVTNAGAAKVIAGAGMKGDLTVGGVTTGTVNAGAAKTVTVTSANTASPAKDVTTVTAGAETTKITVGANTATGEFDGATVIAGAKTVEVTVSAAATTVDATAAAAGAQIAVNGSFDALVVTDTATIKLGNDATVATTGFSGTEKVVLDVAAGKTVTLTANAAAENFDVQGAGDVTVKGAAANLTGDTITKANAGTLTVELTGTGTVADVSKIAANNTKLNATAATVTVKSGQNLEAAALATAATFSASAKSATDVLNVKLTGATYGSITGTATVDQEIETLNLVAAAAQAAGAASAPDLVATALVNAGHIINLSGTNDVKVTAVNAKTLDASALTGELTVEGTATAADVTIAGATGKNNVTFNATALKAAFVGQASDDVVAFGTLAAAAAVTAVTGAGNDTVKATATGLTLAAKGSLVVDAGAGNDTVELTAATGVTGTIVLQFGEGNDTLKLGAATNLSGANLTVTGLEAVQLTDTAVFSGAQLTGQAFAVSSATGSGVLTVNAAAGETVNLSGLSFSNLVNADASLQLNGSTGAETLIGSSAADTITGGTGADIMNGGAGADKFVFAANDSSATAIDTIIGFTTAVDKLDFNTGTGAAQSATTVAKATSVATDLATLLATADASDKSYYIGQVGSDAYVITSAGDIAVADITNVIKLTGVSLSGIVEADIFA